MAETKKAKKSAKGKEKDKDVITRLADRGEEALERIAELPGGTKVLTAFNDVRARVDELGKKVRGIDALEARLAKVEAELATLKKPARSTATRRRAPAKPKPAPPAASAAAEPAAEPAA